MRNCFYCKHSENIYVDDDNYTTRCHKENDKDIGDGEQLECFESENDGTFKFKLGQRVFYLNDNKIYDGEIFARQLIENSYDEDYACTEEQQKFYNPFGNEGKYYNVQCVGIISENKIFETKEDLVNDLLNN
jgi:hypothetical protein